MHECNVCAYAAHFYWCYIMYWLKYLQMQRAVVFQMYKVANYKQVK